MAELFIYWSEIEDGDFPDCCLTCGCDDTELVPRRLETIHYRVIYGYRRYITVDLPFCRAHRSRPWVAWGRTDASSFMDDGVLLKNVSPDFVEEMEAFRDEEDDYDDDRRPKKRKQRRKGAGAEREPFRAPRTPQQPGSSSLAVLMIFGALCVSFMVVGLCCLGSAFLPIQFGPQPPIQPAPGPNFNNPRLMLPKDGPPFGPGGVRP